MTKAAVRNARTRGSGLRDKRFVAEHRGGPLKVQEHRLLATWAAACAEHVIELYGDRGAREVPMHAIELARAWTKGDMPVGDCQKAAIAAHASARAAKGAAAKAAARAAGHAVATAHFADHSIVAAKYALKAIEAAGGNVATERAWQVRKLPKRVRQLVMTTFENRAGLKGPSRTRRASKSAGTPAKIAGEQHHAARRSR